MEQTTINKFSWRRAAATWRFYSPGMWQHCCISAAITAGCYGLALLGSFTDLSTGRFTLASFIFTAVIYCGPLHFARFRDKTFTTQLPATAGERTLVMSVYSFAVIPAVILVSWYVCFGIASIFTDNYDVTGMFMNNFTPQMEASGFKMPSESLKSLQQLQDLVPAAVCLYVVVCSRRSPVVHGIVAIVGTIIAMGFLGGIYGIAVAFNSGLNDAAAGRDFNPEGFMQDFSSNISSLIYVVAIFSVCAVGFIICLIRNKLARRRI